MNTPDPKAGTPSKKFGPKLLLGTAAAVALIVAFEGGKDKDGSSVAYPDKLAGGLPTVCAGLTRHITATPIIVGERWSAEKCHAEETKAIMKVQLQLEKCFVVRPPQSVFDASTSHAWNNGVSATCGSGAMRYWRAGAWREGCRAMVYAPGTTRPVWSYVKTGKTLPNGKPEYKFVQGLFKRRSEEYVYCLTGAT